MKELQPINQHVLLEMDEQKEQQTAAGIIIPDSAKQKSQMAKVAAISNLDEPEISVGDTVIYKEYAGTEMDFEGHRYLVIPYADILAKLVETEAI